MLVISKRALVIIAGFTACIVSLITILGAFNTFSEKADIDTTYKIVIDAGHGGIDSGVSGVKTGVKESDLNLKVAKLLAVKIEEAGMRAVLTRSSSSGLYGTATSSLKKKDMQRRKEIIKSEAPNVVISIHMNYYPLSTRRGAQVFYKESDENAKNLALSIQKNLNGLYKLREYSPLKGDYYLLNCTDYTSVIVECGFLSSPEDEALLLDDAFLEEITFNILCGVIEYASEPTI